MGNIVAWLAGVPKRFALITGLGYAFTGHAGQRRLAQTNSTNSISNGTWQSPQGVLSEPDDESLFHSLRIIKSSDQKNVCS